MNRSRRRLRIHYARNPQARGQSDVMLPEAIRVPADKFEERLYEMPKNKPIVAYCT